MISYHHRRSNLRLKSSPRRHPFNGRSFLAGGVLDSGCGWCRRGPLPDGLDHGLAFPWFVSFMLINLGSCVGYHVMANMRIRLWIPAFFLFRRTISIPYIPSLRTCTWETKGTTPQSLSLSRPFLRWLLPEAKVSSQRWVLPCVSCLASQGRQHLKTWEALMARRPLPTTLRVLERVLSFGL